MTHSPKRPVEEKLHEADLRDGCGKGELVLTASLEAIRVQEKHART